MNVQVAIDLRDKDPEIEISNIGDMGIIKIKCEGVEILVYCRKEIIEKFLPSSPK